jgi:hypothetical protein
MSILNALEILGMCIASCFIFLSIIMLWAHDFKVDECLDAYLYKVKKNMLVLTSCVLGLFVFFILILTL